MASRKLFQFSLAPEPAEAPVAEAPAPTPAPAPAAAPAWEDDSTELSLRLRSGRPSLGSLLVGAGHVTEDQVKDALAEGIRTGERLGEVLVRRRVVTDETIAELLASQWQVPFVKTAALSVDPTAIRQFPHRVARELDAVPIGFERDGVVLVAIAEPSEDTFRRLSERLPDSSCVVIARSALDSLLESRLYAGAPDDPEPLPEPAPVTVALEPTPGDSLSWASVTDVEPVALLPSFGEREEADASLLLDEPEPAFAPELEPEAEPELAPEQGSELVSEPGFELSSETGSELTSEPASDFAPELELEPEPAPEPEPIENGWHASTPAAGELDPDPVPVPAPDRFETAADVAPAVSADEALPSGIDAAMAAITTASNELDKVRSEVAGLGRALELVRGQLAERDAQLAESEAQRETAERNAAEERETAHRLRSELDSNSTVIASIKQQVAGLSERLESIAPPGAEPTDQ
jgi:hypothetical protein